MNDVPTIYCHDISTQYVIKNYVMHAKTKHVEIDSYFVRENMAKHLDMKYVDTKSKIVIVHTKSFGFAHFLLLRNKLMILPRLDFEGVYKT